MNKITTETQKNEIEKLANEHSDALIAYGADLYRQGMLKGAIIGSICVIVSVSVLRVVKKNKITKNR